MPPSPLLAQEKNYLINIKNQGASSYGEYFRKIHPIITTCPDKITFTDIQRFPNLHLQEYSHNITVLEEPFFYHILRFTHSRRIDFEQNQWMLTRCKGQLMGHVFSKITNCYEILKNSGDL